MPRLHQTTRRRLCRWGFALLCALPTLTVASLAGVLRTAIYERWLEGTLGQRLSCPVRIEEPRHPVPGELTARRMRIEDPESGHVLVELEQPRAVRDERGWHWRATVARLHVDQAEGGRAAVARWFRGVHPSGARLEIHCQRLVARGEVGEFATRDAEIELHQEAAGQVIALSLQSDTGDPAARATLRLARPAQATPADWQLDLHCEGTPLPCWLLTAAGAADFGLGAQATWAGQAQLQRAEEGWSGVLRGRLSGVDMDELVGRRFPQHLTGNAEVSIDAAQLTASRLVSARATLSAGPGTIGHELLDAAVAELGLVSHEQARDHERPIERYDRLGVAMLLDGKGLVVRGICPEVGEGVVLAGYRGPMLVEAPLRLTPMAVVRMLGPADEPALMAHAASWQLSRWLPRRVATRGGEMARGGSTASAGARAAEAVARRPERPGVHAGTRPAGQGALESRGGSGMEAPREAFPTEEAVPRGERPPLPRVTRPREASGTPRPNAKLRPAVEQRSGAAAGLPR